MKECRTCHEILSDIEFPYRKYNQTYRTSCRRCESKQRKFRAHFRTESSRQHRKVYEKEYQRRQRADPKYLSKFIIRDAKCSDKRYNRDNNLTREFVDKIIENGCSYCGETTIRMTLDRIDNKLGHTQNNVVAACYRCNMFRGNMPYLAWLNIVPAIKDTLAKGLFGNWSRCGPWKVAGSG